MHMTAIISALKMVLSALRNPVVATVVAVLAFNLWGWYQSGKAAREARSECNAEWAAKLAMEKAKFSARVEAAASEAAKEKAKAEKDIERLRMEAELLKEAMQDAPGCNLSDADLERLRRLK